MSNLAHERQQVCTLFKISKTRAYRFLRYPLSDKRTSFSLFVVGTASVSESSTPTSFSTRVADSSAGASVGPESTNQVQTSTSQSSSSGSSSTSSTSSVNATVSSAETTGGSPSITPSTYLATSGRLVTNVETEATSIAQSSQTSTTTTQTSTITEFTTMPSSSSTTTLSILVETRLFLYYNFTGNRTSNSSNPSNNSQAILRIRTEVREKRVCPLFFCLIDINVFLTIDIANSLRYEYHL